jgi:TetR/AcrR family transcriptional regulator, transcriptional repressor for nem operon
VLLGEEDVEMTASRTRTGSDTADRILDVAQRLVQQRGFNGFSYADVAKELGISTASLHYHFAGKAELGEALIARYASRFAEALEAISSEPVDAPAKLARYAGLYADVFQDERMCLCGMLAAEYQTLPDRMREAVLRFFDDSEMWLCSVLTEGEREGTVRFDGLVNETARTFMAGLEGAMLLARPSGDIERLQAATRGLLTGLTSVP